MTTTEQHEKIFQLDGFRKQENGKRWKSIYCKAYYIWRKPLPNGGEILSNTVPYYSEDMNAIYRVEDNLTPTLKIEYVRMLRNICAAAGCFPECASPSQRVSALVALAEQINAQ